MAASINSSPVQRERDLLGQTVLVIGGSSGIGFETARLARAKGADIILTAREPDRLHRAGLELGASIAAFDATDFGRRGGSSTRCPRPSTTCWSPARSLLHAAGRVRPRRGAPRRRLPISCCPCRSPGTPRARYAREAPCCSSAAPVAAAPQRAWRSSRRSRPRFPP